MKKTNSAEMAANSSSVDAAKMTAEDPNIEAKKRGCWNCCRSKAKVKSGTTLPKPTSDNAPKPPGKCGLCMRRLICCRKTQPISTEIMTTEQERKGCWPCRKQAKAKKAWTDSSMEQVKNEQAKMYAHFS